MTIEIGTLIGLITLIAGGIAIYVKMQVDNAIHKETTNHLKNENDSIWDKLEDNQNKSENKIVSVQKDVNEFLNNQVVKLETRIHEHEMRVEKKIDNLQKDVQEILKNVKK